MDEGSSEQSPAWTPRPGSAVLVDGEREAVVVHIGSLVTGWTNYRNDRGRETGAQLVDVSTPVAYVKFRTPCGVCGWSQQCAMTGMPAEACPYAKPSGIQTGNVTVARLTRRRPNHVKVEE